MHVRGGLDGKNGTMVKGGERMGSIDRSMDDSSIDVHLRRTVSATKHVAKGRKKSVHKRHGGGDTSQRMLLRANAGLWT